MKRRSFLQGLGAATATPIVPAVAASKQNDMAFDPARKPQRAIFQQMVYFNFDGNGEVYTPPTKGKPK
jgi:hypothetical protein